MSVLKVKDSNNVWKSITTIKGDKGDKGQSSNQYEINQLNDLVVFDKINFTENDFESGSWAYTSKVSRASRLRSKMLYPVKVGYKVTFTNPSLKIYFGIFEERTSSSYYGHHGWLSPSQTSQEYVIDRNGYMNIMVESDDESVITINDYDCVITLIDANPKPVVQTVTVTGTTPTITGVENTRYICGQVSTISIIPPSQGIIDVIFTSGSTIAVLTLPQTVMMPDNFAIEANKIYEINILDGIYGAVTSWEVPL